MAARPRIRVLAVSSEWPTAEHPAAATFITRQIDAVRSMGVEVDVEPFRGAANPLNYMRARKRVRRRLRHGKYDVVHAHFGQAALTLIPTTVPFVVTYYGSDLEGIVGRSGAYTVRGALLMRLSRVVARLADEVIVVSPSLGRRLPKGVPYEVIPTAVDVEVFKPASKDEARQDLGFPLDRKLVLFSGRPEVPRKRYDLARRTVDLVTPDGEIELLTISTLPPAGVAKHMQACDALLVTAMHEGAPTMVKEAMACCLPVVSVDVGDVRDTIGGVRGCFVSPDDSPEALSRGLRGVLNGAGRLDDGDLPDELDQVKQAARIVEIYERLVRVGTSRDGRARRRGRRTSDRQIPARKPNP